MSKHARTLFLLLTVLLSLNAAQSQEHDSRQPARKAVSYGFVSPNTREDLKLDQAIKNLHSAAEVRLINETRSIACRVRTRARINRALGNWSDGAENSMVFRVYSDEATVRYAATSLGNRWRQKTVLYFRRQLNGKDRIYLIFVNQTQRRYDLVSKTLDDAGVAYRTLAPLRHSLLVYVVDMDNKLKVQVGKAAGQLHARTLAFTGAAATIGNDTDRDKAQEVFQQEIKSYESTHGLRPAARCRPGRTAGLSSLRSTYRKLKSQTKQSAVPRLTRHSNLL
jgi:hypothetical protein